MKASASTPEELVAVLTDEIRRLSGGVSFYDANGDVADLHVFSQTLPQPQSNFSAVPVVFLSLMRSCPPFHKSESKNEEPHRQNNRGVYLRRLGLLQIPFPARIPLRR